MSVNVLTLQLLATQFFFHLASLEQTKLPTFLILVPLIFSYLYKDVPTNTQNLTGSDTPFQANTNILNRPIPVLY